MSVIKQTLYRKCSTVNIQVIKQLVINVIEHWIEEMLMNSANLSGTLLPSLRSTTHDSWLQPWSLPAQGLPMVARPPPIFPPPQGHVATDSDGHEVHPGPANLSATSPVPWCISGSELGGCVGQIWCMEPMSQTGRLSHCVFMEHMEILRQSLKRTWWVRSDSWLEGIYRNWTWG